MLPRVGQRSSGFHPGFFNWGGGGAASVPLCSHPRYPRWAGGGGGELCQYWLDWTSGERQVCVTIHGCKIAYAHIQLAFEISLSLKISVGGMIPPQILCVCVEGGGQPPSLPPGRNPGLCPRISKTDQIFIWFEDEYWGIFHYHSMNS